MLSTENLPPDLPCSCEISQLKLSSDEKASGKVALQEIDLPKSGLDENTVLPKFSIRDYVFSARSKDIKTNWPFSQKNLLLWLKHEVADLLPPFQPLDVVRDQSVKRCPVENSLIDKEIISHRDGPFVKPSDEFVSAISNDNECNPKLPKDCVNISSGFEEDKKIPSITTSQSHSGINSIPSDKGPGLKLETNTLPEASAAKLESEVPPPPLQKPAESIPGKKCRLIVKLSKANDQSSHKDIPVNNYLVSETMASKVCPVCKVFSSSSNTTLNAHIDQCLSGDSTPKSKEDFKETKHRIKQRKTKLMTDIYLTAKHCTLEELDRRNGRLWATVNSTLVDQELKGCSEEIRKTVSCANVEETGSDSAVYIDANGTKLRILSKFNDVASVSDAQEALRTRKSMKVSKGSKFVSTKKKKKHVQKHNKFLKLVSHGKPFSFSKSHHNDKERDFVTDPEEGKMARHFKTRELKNLGESGTLGRWVCSKRTDLRKKSNVREGHQPLEYDVTHDFPARSPLGETSLAKCRKFWSSISSLKKSKKIENSSSKHHVDLRERPLLRKRMGFSLLGSRVGDEGKSSLALLKQKRKHLGNEHSLMCDNSQCCPPLAEENDSSLGHKTVVINSGLAKNTEGLVVKWEPSLGDHAFSSKGKRFTSLENNFFVPQSKTYSERKILDLQKSRAHFLSGFDEEAMAFESEVGSKYALNGSPNRREEIIDKVPIRSTRVKKITKKRRGTMISKREKPVCPKSTQSRPQCYGDAWPDEYFSVVGTSIPDKLGDRESAGKDVRACGQDIGIEPPCTIAIQGSFRNLTRSLDDGDNKQPSPSTAQCDSQRHVGVYKGSFCGSEASICPTLESLGNAQEMFCSNEVGNDLSGQNIPLGSDVESKYAQGNYYLEVDPIPIPGPPGSYLPSPGDTDLEDLQLQGNSSLTTSQSFEDHHDFVDRDSPDSPFSVTSTISNSALERSELKRSEMLSAGHHAVKDDHLVENSAPSMQAMAPGAETSNLDEQKVDAFFSENTPLDGKYDLSCCCSDKEGTFHRVTCHQKSQLLAAETTMTSVPKSVIENQMNYDPSKRINNLNLSSELFYPRNHTIYEPGKVGLPANESPAGNIPMKISADSEVKFHIRGDCDSASPSSSVLRLMGKNLMVINNDENVQTQLGQAQTNTMDDHPHPKFCSVSGIFPGNIRSEGYHSFNHFPSQAPLICGQTQRSTVEQGFDVGISYSSGSTANYETLQSVSHMSEVLFNSKNTAGGFAIPSLLHEYQDGCSLPTKHHRPKSIVETPLTYNMVKNMRIPVPKCRNLDSTSSHNVKIAILEDVPRCEVDSATDIGIIGSQSFCVGTPFCMPSEYNERQLNPLYSCEAQKFSSYAGSTPIHNASFQMPALNGVSGGPVKWHCIQEGSLRQTSSLTTPETSTGHLRPTLYYSPNYL